jgi:hypothetical protein
MQRNLNGRAPNFRNWTPCGYLELPPASDISLNLRRQDFQPPFKNWTDALHAHPSHFIYFWSLCTTTLDFPTINAPKGPNFVFFLSIAFFSETGLKRCVKRNMDCDRNQNECVDVMGCRHMAPHPSDRIFMWKQNELQPSAYPGQLAGVELVNSYWKAIVWLWRCH